MTANTGTMVTRGQTGNSFTKEAIREQLAKRNNIVHFACHAHFDNNAPQYSGLHLTNPSSPLISNILTVKDLIEWKFEADLVVLSACETGLGSDAQSEFIGLTRSFISAGANCVISALWKINALKTREFMLSFYNHLRLASKSNDEVNVAEILNKTQVELSGHNHIYDWAGLKLTGWPIIHIKR